MTDFVAETANLSIADWASGADADTRIETLRESAQQASLATLDATLWAAETGFGSAGAALEMAKLARQSREQSVSLFRKVTMAR